MSSRQIEISLLDLFLSLYIIRIKGSRTCDKRGVHKEKKSSTAGCYIFTNFCARARSELSGEIYIGRPRARIKVLLFFTSPDIFFVHRSNNVPSRASHIYMRHQKNASILPIIMCYTCITSSTKKARVVKKGTRERERAVHRHRMSFRAALDPRLSTHTCVNASS